MPSDTRAADLHHARPPIYGPFMAHLWPIYGPFMMQNLEALRTLLVYTTRLLLCTVNSTGVVTGDTKIPAAPNGF
jgi:hypothetical protein